MATRIVTLADGTRVEVEVDPRNQLIADDGPTQVDKVLNDATPLLVKAAGPVVAALREINKEMKVDQAEIELGFAFEAEGNLFITRSKLNASLTITLTLKPADHKPNPQG